jgi:phosphoribosylanthranilate isomerase
MRPVQVKVCGLTRHADAEIAVGFGASAVGLIFWAGSPRVVAPNEAAAVVTGLPPFVARVGVFVNATPDHVKAVVEQVGLDVVQLHGEERVGDYADVGAQLVKVVTLDTNDDIQRAVDLPAGVMPLVDATDRARRGGTGKTADWTRAAEVAAHRPTILAGGLTADNIAEAVRTVRPFAVDVSSGVEDAPGVKSPERLRQFFAALAAAIAEDM